MFGNLATGVNATLFLEGLPAPPSELILPETSTSVPVSITAFLKVVFILFARSAFRNMD